MIKGACCAPRKFGPPERDISGLVMTRPAIEPDEDAIDVRRRRFSRCERGGAGGCALLNKIDKTQPCERANSQAQKVSAGHTFAVAFGADCTHLLSPSQFISYRVLPKGSLF